MSTAIVLGHKKSLIAAVAASRNEVSCCFTLLFFEFDVVFLLLPLLPLAGIVEFQAERI